MQTAFADIQYEIIQRGLQPFRHLAELRGRHGSHFELCGLRIWEYIAAVPKRTQFRMPSIP